MLGTGPTLLALGSLETLAAKVVGLAKELDAWICPMLDARRMEVYCAIFDAQLHSQMPIQAKIIEEDAFEDLLATQKIIFVGDGVAKCREILEKHSNAILLDEALSSAGDMGKELYRLFQEKAFEDLQRFEPFYLKSFVATKSKKKYF